jgi:putative ABC transport system permease protein
MTDLFKLAVRNIMRNTRRSLLTVMMTFISVTFVIVSSSFLTGMFSNLLSESIRSTGHVQITTQDHDIQERKMSLTGSIGGYGRIRAAIVKVAKVNAVVGRLRFGSLIFKGDEWKEALGYGIEAPDVRLLRLKDVVYQGHPVRPNAKDEIIIGRLLAESLKLKIGDRVTLMARTLYNSTWALNFRVVGFFDRQNKVANRSYYITLPIAQELLDMNDRVTEMMVFGKSIGEEDDSVAIIKNLRELKAVKGLAIRCWDEIGVAAASMKMLSGLYTIMQLIFIVLAGLGIANTMMMAVFERKSEIGLLKSLGMRDKVIGRLFIIEGVLMGLVGTVIGLLVGGVLAYLMATKGINLGESFTGLPMMIGRIVYGGFNIGIFIKGLVLGIGAAFLATCIPVKRIIRIKPSEALKG